MSGIVSYHAGLSAEAAIADHYTRQGLPIIAERWRGQVGEIDLIAQDGAALILIEVKKSRSFARAAERLSQAQLSRIWATAAEFAATQPRGQNTDMRLDVALVDGKGAFRIIENVVFDSAY